MLNLLLSMVLVVMFILYRKTHRALQQEKTFASNLSHELKTPLTIIHGYAEIIPQTEMTEKILCNCTRMEQIIQSLLHMDREPDCHPCSLDTLILQSKAQILTVSPTTIIDIEQPKEPIIADIDPHLFEIALMNLLENGVKYSSSPAHLKISLAKKSGSLVITVQDHGLGIPQQDLPHIFKRFYKGHQTRRLVPDHKSLCHDLRPDFSAEHSAERAGIFEQAVKRERAAQQNKDGSKIDKEFCGRAPGGIGLGLYLVKSIVEKHRGTISVQSTVGQGSTFTLIIPQHHKLQKAAYWDAPAANTQEVK